jgi:adenylate kinase
MAALETGGLSVCVGGIPDAGKTTLVRAYARSEGSRYRAVAGSDVLKDILSPLTVEDLDKWPVERRIQVREEAIMRLTRLRDGSPGRLLVDGHFTLRNRSTGVIEPVFTAADCGFFDALVLVEADGKRVHARRIADQGGRPVDPIARIEEHLSAERREAARLAERMGVPFLVVNSVRLSDQKRQLADFLRLLGPIERSS